MRLDHKSKRDKAAAGSKRDLDKHNVLSSERFTGNTARDLAATRSKINLDREERNERERADKRKRNGTMWSENEREGSKKKSEKDWIELDMEKYFRLRTTLIK